MRKPSVSAPSAFREQLLAAIPRLRRYARSLVYDVATADDLVQTALERALAHWHQYDQRRDIVLWLIAIARNAFLDEKRRSARMPTTAADELPAELQATAQPDMGLRMDLVAALRQLPAEQREPLLLVTLEQLSYAECADLLHVPIGTVMSRISRGRAALRKLLDGSGPQTAQGLRRVV